MLRNLNYKYFVKKLAVNMQKLYPKKHKVSCRQCRLPPQHKKTQVPHATIMQPVQCVLQHRVHIHVAMAMPCASPRCRTPRRNRLRSKQSKPQPPRTHTHKVPFRFIAGCSHFTQKNRRLRAPASSVKQSPFNSHAAITMRFAALRAHPCGHYIAICIHALQNTKGEPITPETIQTATAAHTHTR